MKDMLAMNRVNFKGVVEKQELLKIVERVWRQHVKSTEGKENTSTIDYLIGKSQWYKSVMIISS